MLQCNACAVNNCAIAKKFNQIRHGDDSILTPLELQSSCRFHVPLSPLTINMFSLAMFNNSQGVYDTLTAIKMKIVSQGQYPYFKIVSQFSRKKKRRRRKKN